MAAGISGGQSSGYVVRLGSVAWQSLAQLVRTPSHSRRAEARRALARRWLGLAVLTALAIGLLMFAVDVTAIKLMPARGTASLWPLRIFTDFGKSTYVLWALAAALLVILLLIPRLTAHARQVLIAFGVRVQYIFLSVAVAVIGSEILKYIIGRSRPFVGGEANAFNFQHFAGNPAFESLPSGHATTAFALAFAVSAVWRKVTLIMLAYAVLICVSRVILLAHHPSDVVGGALTGVIGAMFVRYWFAARRLGFTIDRDGGIEPLAGPSFASLKRVAREALAP
ncbi:phosphatidylglycerophosphatase B [Bradyrhizobiaceae bacterium SG-6C]|nr:phosphatidylglycerophosphatase B [Bradyrhizobiaceae bacterium SG-6C]